jgi:hypothetical protein
VHVSESICNAEVVPRVTRESAYRRETPSVSYISLVGDMFQKFCACDTSDCIETALQRQTRDKKTLNP